MADIAVGWWKLIVADIAVGWWKLIVADIAVGWWKLIVADIAVGWWKLTVDLYQALLTGTNTLSSSSLESIHCR